MPKAARKAPPQAKKARKAKRKQSLPLYYWEIISAVQPSKALLQGYEWIRLPRTPPAFKTVRITPSATIHVDDKECHLSRGKTQTGPDQVCWVNQDVDTTHRVRFTGGLWPFDPALDPGDQSITVGPAGTSPWYVIWRESRGKFLYDVDVVPGSPGPVIFSED